MKFNRQSRLSECSFKTAKTFFQYFAYLLRIIPKGFLVDDFNHLNTYHEDESTNFKPAIAVRKECLHGCKMLSPYNIK